jgi:uncharacterized membrane protein
MPSQYLFAKFLHVFIAIVALGTSAGLGLLLEFYGNHPSHGSFVLRAIHRITVLVVLPGYTLMLATGLWLVSLSWPLTAKWILFALALWPVGILALVSSLVLVARQRQLLDSSGLTSDSYRRVSVLGRAVGGSFGVIVVLIMCLMVFKPWS